VEGEDPVFRSILLTTDGAPLSRVAVAHAARLVDHRAGTIRILHVAVDAHRGAAEAEVEAIRRALVASGVASVETHTREGAPGDTIVDEARACGADVVAMATHGRSGLARTLMGSVADHVLRELRGVPVLLVRPTREDARRFADDAWATIPETRIGPADRPYRSVLVPLDGSDFAMSVLPLVAHAIDRANTAVDLLLVLDALPHAPDAAASRSEPAEEVAPQTAASFGDREAAAWLEEARRRLEVARARLAADGVRRVDTVIRDGIPEEVIADYANRRAPELVVMATHGRSGVARTLLGSVPDSVLRHLEGRPLLLLRPGAVAASPR
jgi:nucleotide-binding universal stress UspA family protein